MNRHSIFFIIASLILTVSCSRTIPQSNDFTLSEGWKIQSSAKTALTGEALSTNGAASTDGWYDASVPSTVLGSLCDNGLYKDALTGMNYDKLIKRDDFEPSWWYVRDFSLPALMKDQRICLEFEGISYYAEVWLNGSRIASKDEMYGPFRQFSFDVTKLVKENNTLAVEVFRCKDGDFNIGFVDWNPRAADESMGIFRPVWVRYSNDVAIKNPAVKTVLDTATLKTAWLTVEATLQNLSAKQSLGELQIELEGRKYSKTVTLEPGESRLVTISPEECSFLKVKNPRIWWCHNLGNPEMYSMKLSYSTQWIESDACTVDFGIRQIDSYMTPEGHRGFILNGKKVLVKGAGWTDDIFLRNPDSRNDIELEYVKDMNLNAVRFENIWGTSQNVYDLCDRKGLLALVGWSCFWEWETYAHCPADQFGCIKTDKDMDLMAESFRDQILWLRNHPSIIAWYVGSDMLPRPALEKKYLEVLAQCDNRPYVASAKALNSVVSGPTGMKMVGPYDYQAPSYWYDNDAPGGSFGFNTETGIGAQLPVIESIKKMIPQDKLWPVGDAYDYHCTVAGEDMHSLDVLKQMIELRYGAGTDLEDFLKKAHHLDYDGTRAMFEGFRVAVPRSTGVIQWMLNSAWPSLYWQLYDWYLQPTASYYSVKKACQPQQLVYNYKDKSVYAVNDEAASMELSAKIQMYDINGRMTFESCKEISLAAGTSALVEQLPQSDGVSFLFLTLCDSLGAEVADNSYCISAVDDVHDWNKYNWIRTPLKQNADYTALANMKEADVKTSTKAVEGGIEVSLENSSDVVAFFIRTSLKDADGELVTPAFWSDNFVSLRPGEKRVLRCKAEVPEQWTVCTESWN